MKSIFLCIFRQFEGYNSKPVIAQTYNLTGNLIDQNVNGNSLLFLVTF